jgi:hypothetical protein
VYQVKWDGEGLEAYRPVGWWLVEYLRLWDRWNVAWMDEQKRMLDEEERAAQHRDAPRTRSSRRRSRAKRATSSTWSSGWAAASGTGCGNTQQRVRPHEQ